MNIHKNARLTPTGRANLIKKIQEIGLPAAAQEMAVSTNTARKWLQRWQAKAELQDQSSRPLKIRQSYRKKNACSIALRKKRGLHYPSITERVGLPTSTVARHCATAMKAHGCGAMPVLRYEKDKAGESCCTWIPSKTLTVLCLPVQRHTFSR